jgi:hypothetical protein
MGGLRNLKVPSVLLASLLWSMQVHAGEAVFATTTPKAATPDTDAHLMGWWKFDEAGGKQAADSSGQGRDGSLEGGLSFDTHSAAGRAGQALKLDGQGQWVRVAGFKGVTGTKPRTVCAWIKTPGASGEIVSWGTDDHGKMWVFGHIRGRLGVTPKGGYLYMNESTADDAWHHVAVVVQEGAPPNLHDHVQLYRDGALAVIHDIGLLDLWPIETGDQLEVRIGRGFKGLLDDLRVYDRPLSEEEIGALFKLQSAHPTGKR